MTHSLVQNTSWLIGVLVIPMGLYLAGKALFGVARFSGTYASQAPAPKGPDLQEDWAGVKARLDAATQRWLAYDHAREFLELPAMRDFSSPVIRSCFLALEAADSEDRPRPPKTLAKVTGSAFDLAVREFELQLDGAEQWARRTMANQMSQDERDELQLVRDMLAKVFDAASAPNERHAAYQRASKILGRLGLELPKPAVQQIEAIVRAELPPASDRVVSATAAVKLAKS
jgi:hypothetical protein